MSPGPVPSGANFQGLSGRTRASHAGGRNNRPTAPSTRVDSRGSPVRRGDENQARNRISTTQDHRQPVFFHPLGPPQWNWGRELTNAGKENVAPGEVEASRQRPLGPVNSSSQHSGGGALQTDQTVIQCLDKQPEGEVSGRESLESCTSRIVNLSDDEDSVIQRSADTQILSPSPLSALRAAQLVNIAGMVEQGNLGTPEQTQQPGENAAQVQHEQQTLGAVESSVSSGDAGPNRAGIVSPQADVSSSQQGELTDNKSDNNGAQDGHAITESSEQHMPHMNAPASGGHREPNDGAQVVQTSEAPQIGSPEEASTIKSRLKKRFLRLKDKVRGIRLLPKKS